MTFFPGGSIPVLEGWTRIVVGLVAIASVVTAAGLIISVDVLGVPGIIGGLLLGIEGFYLGRSALTGRWLLDGSSPERPSAEIGRSAGRRAPGDRWPARASGKQRRDEG